KLGARAPYWLLHAGFQRLHRLGDRLLQPVIVDLHGVQSRRAPEALMTLANFTISDLIKVPNSSGVPATSSYPSFTIWSRTAGVLTIFTTAPWSSLTTPAGVPAATGKPHHAKTSKPGMVSESAGTSGTVGKRLALVTASALTFPVSMSGIAGEIVENIIGIRPPRRSVSAPGTPLYGTWTMSSPALVLNSSMVRCGALP